jgi:hypothetical protein
MGAVLERIGPEVRSIDQGHGRSGTPVDAPIATGDLGVLGPFTARGARAGAAGRTTAAGHPGREGRIP